MLIEMKINLHGYRQGVAWPMKGETLEVGEAEAEQLIANGYAVAADPTEESDASDAEHEDTETADGSEEDQPEPGDEDAEPTKEDLLAQAKELGLKVDGRSSAETIAAAIAEAEAEV